MDVVKHSNNLSYALILVVLAFVIFYSTLSASGFNIDILLVGIAVLAGLASTYFIYHSLQQEKKMQFFPEEQLIIASTSERTFATLLRVGDRTFPLDPIHANIYLTNIGISCEPKGSGEVAIFIPLDLISDFGLYQAGIMIRYADPQSPVNETYLLVDDKEHWMQTLYSILSPPNQPL